MTKRTPTSLCNPSLLEWARESMGYSLEIASQKASVNPEQLASWEAGDLAPSMAQLRTLARLYKRPSAIFYLKNPPRGWDAMRDFRRVQGATQKDWTPELHSEYRRANEQRESALELLELLSEQSLTDWKISAPNDETLATLARERLKEHSSLNDPTSPRGYQRFAYWASALERCGVLVMTSDGVSVSEMRGFSIHADQLPVIMVNGKEAWNGRVFSLLHEYAHLLLQAGGLCDQRVTERPSVPVRVLEARCNAIAASILIPKSMLLQDFMVASAPDGYSGWSKEDVLSIAGKYGVSAETALRRLLEVGKASRQLYEQRRAEWLELYAENQETRSTPPRSDYYKLHVRNLGKGYVRLVFDAFAGRAIDSYTAASFLNAKVSSLPGLSQAAKLASDH